LVLIEATHTHTHTQHTHTHSGGGTLADMVRIKPLSEPLTRFYMRQLIPAIKYCHKQGLQYNNNNEKQKATIPKAKLRANIRICVVLRATSIVVCIVLTFCCRSHTS
jgi:serine/threonine protein kinase